MVLALALNLISRSASVSGIKLNDLTGHFSSPVAGDGRKATVVIFVLHDCPVANAYAPEINRLAGKYSPHGVKFQLLYEEADLSVSDAIAHRRSFGYLIPGFLDSKYRFSHAVGATVTPSVAIFDPSKKLIYLGRIDNAYFGIGQRRPAATIHDVSNVLNSVLNGKKVALKRTVAYGCFISPQ